MFVRFINHEIASDIERNNMIFISVSTFIFVLSFYLHHSKRKFLFVVGEYKIFWQASYQKEHLFSEISGATMASFDH